MFYNFKLIFKNVGYRGIKLKEEGYPVEVVFPKEGSG
ncbi:hypothetical protein BN165_1830112 [Clostridioides difficile E1]|nr:hypothetical protein BN163_1930111 [Clostridioides difficile T5]CCK92323.1 hypothetical protein BN164_1810111 [Clostridioides difficile T20]CCK96023.1 hypothetical protein BN165_1830112 [Clostridioides difficile E1]CCK99972.1 hypothetical protein BN166_2360111 [Clostridioides difficile E10]